MATTTVKGTYSLDLETVQTLEEIAKRWKVTKSEALRRAIQAAAGVRGPETDDPIRALDRFQRSLGLTPRAADRWQREVRLQRKASSRRLERR